jgi:hypothetical protein
MLRLTETAVSFIFCNLCASANGAVSGLASDRNDEGEHSHVDSVGRLGLSSEQTAMDINCASWN